MGTVAAGPGAVEPPVAEGGDALVLLLATLPFPAHAEAVSPTISATTNEQTRFLENIKCSPSLAAETAARIARNLVDSLWVQWITTRAAPRGARGRASGCAECCREHGEPFGGVGAV